MRIIEHRDGKLNSNIENFKIEKKYKNEKILDYKNSYVITNKNLFGKYNLIFDNVQSDINLKKIKIIKNKCKNAIIKIVFGECDPTKLEAQGMYTETFLPKNGIINLESKKIETGQRIWACAIAEKVSKIEFNVSYEVE